MSADGIQVLKFRFFSKDVNDINVVFRQLCYVHLCYVMTVVARNHSRDIYQFHEVFRIMNPASTDRRGPCGLKTGCPVCPVQRVMAGQNVGIGTGPIGERGSLMCQ